MMINFHQSLQCEAGLTCKVSLAVLGLMCALISAIFLKSSKNTTQLL